MELHYHCLTGDSHEHFKTTCFRAHMFAISIVAADLLLEMLRQLCQYMIHRQKYGDNCKAFEKFSGDPICTLLLSLSEVGYLMQHFFN